MGRSSISSGTDALSLVQNTDAHSEPPAGQGRGIVAEDRAAGSV